MQGGENIAAAMISPCDECDIRDLAICGALRVDEIQTLNRIMMTVSFAAGNRIVDEGEPCDFVYTLTRGAMRLSKLLADGRRSVTGFLFPGDFLGVSMPQTHITSAEAITPVTLCRFRRTDLTRLLGEIPSLERRLFARATEELDLAQEQIVLLGRKTAAERVASFLHSLGARQEKRHLPANPVSVPMTRTDIADYLGLTTETVSRTLTRFKGKGLIRMENASSIRLLDGAGLEGIAEATGISARA